MLYTVFSISFAWCARPVHVPGGSRNSILESSLSAWLSTCFLARALLRPLSSTVVDTPYRCSSYMWKMHVFGSKITLRTCSEHGTFYMQKTKIITIILLHTQARLVLCVCVVHLAWTLVCCSIGMYRTCDEYHILLLTIGISLLFQWIDWVTRVRLCDDYDNKPVVNRLEKNWYNWESSGVRNSCVYILYSIA